MEENIFVYHLYRAARNDVANSISEYQEIAIIEKYNSPGIEYIDQDIHTNTRYFYKLQAEDESGNFSDSSATISYMVFSSAGFFRMEPNGLTDGFIENRTLKWWSSYTLGIEDYILTVLTTHNEILIRVRIQPTNYVSESEEWQIPYEVDLVFGEQYLWRIDMGARYENGVETAGSESPWASFLVGL